MAHSRSARPRRSKLARRLRRQHARASRFLTWWAVGLLGWALLAILMLAPAPQSRGLWTWVWAWRHKPALYLVVITLAAALGCSVAAWSRRGVHRAWLVVGWVVFLVAASLAAASQVQGLMWVLWRQAGS